MESLNNSFNQGRIFLTVDPLLDKEIIRLICEEVKNNHTQFTNIIICVYTNTEIGISLSKGLHFDYGTENKKNVWLALYSFNPVEGEYFDDMPSGYINNY